MDKKQVVYTYHGVLFNPKKKTPDIGCNNIDEPEGYYAR